MSIFATQVIKQCYIDIRWKKKDSVKQSNLILSLVNPVFGPK